MKVSTLILTFNEERNLPACLAALSWCDDILVLDSGSTDDTVAIATRHGARVLTRPFDTFANQRNHGLENGDLRHEWVLHLDADEVLTPAFVEALRRLEPTDDTDAYYVPSKLILFGRWLRYSGMYPTYQARLGHRERLRFKQVGHGQREDVPTDRMATFDEPYLHHSFSQGMTSWLQKHIRYARDEAALIRDLRVRSDETTDPADRTTRRRRAKAQAARIPPLLRPVLRFVYIYVVKQGFRDGRAGLAYALMLSVYEGMTSLFLLEADLSQSERAPRPRQGAST